MPIFCLPILLDILQKEIIPFLLETYYALTFISACLHVDMSAYLHNCTSTCMNICISVHSLFCISMCLHIFVPAYPCICISMYLDINISPNSIYLSVYILAFTCNLTNSSNLFASYSSIYVSVNIIHHDMASPSLECRHSLEASPVQKEIASLSIKGGP